MLLLNTKLLLIVGRVDKIGPYHGPYDMLHIRVRHLERLNLACITKLDKVLYFQARFQQYLNTSGHSVTIESFYQFPSNLKP